MTDLSQASENRLAHIIAADKLISLLHQLPSGAMVMPNRVLNLAIIDSETNEQLGYIDLFFEKIVFYAPEGTR